jgi:hypothetical protein
LELLREVVVTMNFGYRKSLERMTGGGTTIQEGMTEDEKYWWRYQNVGQ